jgi:peptidoglycan/LPS O-acetylase OafA/YrhL
MRKIALMPTASASFKYIPALDGMRAVAILLVIGSHFGLDFFVPGGFGVTLFFFISGFLITRLLIAEEKKTGEVLIAAFYIRRFLRLGPALAVMIIVVSSSYFLVVGAMDYREIVAAIFYSMNYYGLFFQVAMPIGILWSLAVEEHYYAVYPVIFSLSWKFRERFVLGLVLVSLAILLWRIYLVFGSSASIDGIYYRTDTRIDSILYGAILAGMLEIRAYDVIVARIATFEGFAVATLIIILTFVYRNDAFRETIRYTLQGFALIPIFVSVLFVDRFSLIRQFLERRLMIWIGRLSYSLYLWHEAILFFAGRLFPSNSLPIRYLVVLPSVFGVAALSYYLVEKPFQAIRRKMRGDSETKIGTASLEN